MIRLAIRCRREHADQVLAELLELAPGGVEEDASNEPLPSVWADDDGRRATNVPAGSEPPMPVDSSASRPGSTGSMPEAAPSEDHSPADYVEYAIYGAPGELPELPELEAVVGGVPIEVVTTEIPDDWADRWRDFHEPALVAGGRLVVRPSWIEDSAPQGEELSIVIDPGRAFGTGAHATTKLTLELLLALADERGGELGPLVDLGTGSGVIAIAAAKLGWNPVSAIDHELPAVEAATENARLNDVEVSASRLNLRQSPPPAAPTLSANLTAPLLEIVAGWLGRDPALVPERLVCSGMLTTEADAVAGAFGRCGLSVENRASSGEWCGLALRRV